MAAKKKKVNSFIESENGKIKKIKKINSWKNTSNEIKVWSGHLGCNIFSRSTVNMNPILSGYDFCSSLKKKSYYNPQYLF